MGRGLVLLVAVILEFAEERGSSERKGRGSFF